MARKYKPATFQPTVRPDWGGVLSYIPDKEKINILEALIKYPSIECNSKFWLETIKPDLDLQFEEFKRQCEAKSRGIRNRWGKTSITTLKHNNKNSISNVIVSEEEGIEKREDEKQLVDKDNINVIINKLEDILFKYHNRHFQTKSWLDSIDKMLRLDKVSFNDVLKNLDWYSEHIGEDYVPVIESGKSLREKYAKLESAVKRGLAGKQANQNTFGNWRGF